MGIFDNTVKIKVTRIYQEAEVPRKKHANEFADAAYDLFAYDELNTEDSAFRGTLKFEPNERKLVDTGIRVAIPDGYWIKFHERSGLANKGIHILGGVIDSGYTGELKVIMYNSTSMPFSMSKEAAIAQFTVEKVTNSCLELISGEDMDLQATLRERKDKGFGSSDAK